MSRSAQIAVGTVVSLWRYPVKSMMGEELNAAGVNERGLVGDRAFALVDSFDGKVASAKNPKKWPRLFDFRAAFVEGLPAGAEVPPVSITMPDGTMVSSEQGDLDQVLSRALDREVRFKAAQRNQADVAEPGVPGAWPPRPRSTGQIWRAWTFGTQLPTSICQRARFSTAPWSIC